MLPPINQQDFEFTLEQQLELIKLSQTLIQATKDDLIVIVEALTRQNMIQRNVIKSFVKQQFG
jgi:hypothetical protein